MEDGSTVEKSIYVESSTTTPPLIEFTIDGTTYQAVEGMTWAEWVESEYNTGGYCISSDSVFTQDASGTHYLRQTAGLGGGALVDSSWSIDPEKTYTTQF